MRARALAVAAFLAAAGASSPAAPAEVEDGYRHGRVRFVEAGVTLQRATEVSAEEALPNVPFLPGDRVWTDANGRVEFQFPGGSVVRLDRRSKLDYAGHEEARAERIVLRLWSGSLLVRLRGRDAPQVEIETPAGTVQALDQAMLRLDVEAGESRVSVYRGEAILDDGQRRVRLAAGERTFARWGAAAEEPQPFDLGEEDDFAGWDDLRESEERWAARSSEYLPDELDPYAGELERNGTWRYEGAVGYVWAPQVSVGWSPYWNGHWSWTPYGWTWIPYETWGWAPFHYGRWGFSLSFGWYWSPGSAWGPGWVSWGVGSGYVGWCPLGHGGRPVYSWGRHRGHAVPRGAGHGGWNVVRQADLGSRDLARRRIPLAGLGPESLHVGQSAELRPTRDARALRPERAAARAISRRPVPGDFVRELAVDNKTTIPAPWTRGYGSRPAGASSARDGARESRQQTMGARRRGEPAGAVTATPQASRSEGQRRAATPSRAPRAAPWYAPRAPQTGVRQPEARAVPPARAERPESRRSGSLSGSAERQEPSDRVRPRTGDTSRTPRSGAVTSARPRSSGDGYRPRSERSESPGGYQPRSGAGSDSGARPRAERSAPRPPRNDGGGSSARPSGGGSRSSSRGGGGHAAPRPNRQPH